MIAFSGIVVMAVALAFVLKWIGLFSEVILAAIILMTVALGVVIATLKEKDNFGSANWPDDPVDGCSW